VLPIKKQKHNWNWSVKNFVLHIRFSKISLFRMVVKRLKLHQFLMGSTNSFLHTSMGVGKGTGIWNFQQKTVFLVLSGKKQISPLLAPFEKLLKNPQVPPWIKSFRRPCTQAYKLHHFCKNCVVIYHLATLFNNTNAVSTKQAIAGWQTRYGVFCHTITKSCQIHCQVTNNILKRTLTKYCQNSTTFFSLNNLL